MPLSGLTPSPTAFPPKYWDGKLFALTILSEFVRVTNSVTGNTLWDQFHNELAAFLPANAAAFDKELKEVVTLIEYRSGVMAEALAQRTNPWAWSRGILMCNSKSAPVTHQLVTIAAIIGEIRGYALQDGFQAPEAVAIFAGFIAAGSKCPVMLRFQVATQLKPFLSP